MDFVHLEAQALTIESASMRCAPLGPLATRYDGRCMNAGMSIHPSAHEMRAVHDRPTRTRL